MHYALRTGADKTGWDLSFDVAIIIDNAVEVWSTCGDAPWEIPLAFLEAGLDTAIHLKPCNARKRMKRREIVSLAWLAKQGDRYVRSSVGL